MGQALRGKEKEGEKMIYYTCENCGANLAPGEICECTKKPEDLKEQNKKSPSCGTLKGSTINSIIV